MTGFYEDIGPWSEIKLEIIKKYSQAYSQILSTQQVPLKHVYIDAFAGAGTHISRKTGETVPGSPQNALYVLPPFKKYYFIDIKKLKIRELEKISQDRKDVFIYHGDCNRILIEDILPKIRYEDYYRALCLLDPYGLHLEWEVIKKASDMKTIEIFLNFPLFDINRNVLWCDPEKTDKKNIERMNRFWGDNSWREEAYQTQYGLFEDKDIKKHNYAITKAFQKRLKEIGDFKFVIDPLPMKNSRNAVIYYLFFATHNQTGANIARDIFKQYRR
jgi:three-Cys-motif partner protein